MKDTIRSMRPFIGSRDYEVSRNFYRDIGFVETILSEKMSYLRLGSFGFYLQDYYVKDWVDNTMVFLETENTEKMLKEIAAKKPEERYPGVRLSEIRENYWGREFFLHDPSGVLWHVGEFYT